MKQIIACAAFLLILAGGVSAQNSSMEVPRNVEVTEGEIFETKNTLYRVLGKGNGKFYALLGKSSMLSEKYSVARFGSDMTYELEKELAFKIDGNSVNYEYIMYSKEGLLLFTSYLNKDQGKKFLFSEKLDLKTLEVIGKAVKVAEIDVTSRKENRTSGFTVKFSPDSTKILVYYDKPYGKNEDETFGMHVLDNNLNEIWNADVSVPYADKSFVIGNVQVINSGNVLVAGALYKDKSERDKKTSSYNYLVFEFEEGGKGRREYTIDLDGKFVKSLISGVNEAGDLVCGGFYTDQSKVGAMGSFFISFDRDSKQILQKSFKEFDVSFIAEDLSKKGAKKVEKKAEKGKDVGIPHLDLDRAIHKEDGGLVLIGEQYWVTESTTTSSNGTSKTRYTYHYYDIILVGVSATGDIEWNAKIPKRQIVTTSSRRTPPATYFFSYGTMVSNSSVYIFFNENPENMMYKGDGKIKPLKFKEPLVVIVQVDSDGRVFKNSLLTKGRGKNVIAQPSVSKQTGEEELLMYMERKKKKSFVEVTVKQRI